MLQWLVEDAGLVWGHVCIQKPAKNWLSHTILLRIREVCAFGQLFENKYFIS